MIKQLTLLALASALIACGGGGDSNFGTVNLAAGFTAPAATEGRAGGTTDASTLNASCNGNISETPDHLVVLAADMANLHIFAKSEADITLVVQQPDGSYLCNDDHTDLNPLVTAANFPAGTYKVWIGNYNSEEGGASYKLGFSTAADATPNLLQ